MYHDTVNHPNETVGGSECSSVPIFALRPTTQDRQSARDQLKRLPPSVVCGIAAYYVENESGAKLARPELFRLLAVSHPGDVLLIEQVDRLSRSPRRTGKSSALSWPRVRCASLRWNLPTSWMLATQADDFTGRMFDAINSMMLDVLAAVARKELRGSAPTSAQGQGQERAKVAGVYKGRPRMPSGTPELRRCCARVVVDGCPTGVQLLSGNGGEDSLNGCTLSPNWSDESRGSDV